MAGRRAGKRKGRRDLTEFYERLVRLRDRLQGDVQTLADGALHATRQDASGDLSTMPSHLADLGSDTYEQEFTLRLLENEEEVLEQVREALRRFEAGRYGDCVRCGGPIPKKRLRVLPFTPYCIACARAREMGT